ncbi:MAG TPA: sugar phosphate isomerase/epimerase [Anaerolineae bacterium]|nr:sugar phosphate isomerase/epimerase [Anaerolineae bacterium]
MKLGLMSAALPNLSLAELAEWASANGFEMLELACWPVSKAERRYAGVTHIDVTELTPAKSRDILGLMEKHRLQISSLGYYPNPLHPDANHRTMVIDHLKKVIAAAEMLNVPIVGTFVGRDKNKTIEDNFIEFEKVWPPIVKFAADHGVKIAIENCPMIFSNDEWPGGNNLATTPAIWRKMWEIIPAANFGLNLDPSHLIWQMIDVVRVIYEFGPRIFHVHAKDLRIDREQLYQRGILSLGMGWEIPRLPGLGDVNWAQFISALYGAGYDYVISIEHEDRAFEKTEELVKRGFLISRDVLRPYIH